MSRAKGVAILLPLDLVARIDAIRDPLVPRAALVKALIREGLREREDRLLLRPEVTRRPRRSR